MKKIIIILFILSLSSSDICLSQSGWFQLNSPTNKHIYSVYFTGLNTGYAVGDTGLIIKTTNSGLNGSIINSGLWVQLIDLKFFNENTGYVMGKGIILRTTNAGQNWTYHSYINDYFNAIYFIDENTWLVCGGWTEAGFHYGRIFRTTNSGQLWSQVFSNYDILYTIYFIDQFTGFCGGGGGRLYKTISGGNSWFLSQSGIIYGSAEFNNTFGFLDNSTGFVGGRTIYKTTNGGLNWINLYLYSFFTYKLYVVNGYYVYAIGTQGTIKMSSDVGVSWYNQVSNTNQDLRGMYFINSDVGFIVGKSGTILKTTNGGNPTGAELNYNDIPLTFSLSQNYPNPFNPVTRIKYDVPPNVKGQTANVRLIIYDVLGREIETLINETQKPGSYEVQWDGSRYASGVYFYKLMTDEWTETKKMILIK